SIKEMERPTFLDYMGPKTHDLSQLTRRQYATYDAVIFLVDELALGARLAQYAAVLPGMMIDLTEARDSLTETDGLILDMIAGNQYVKYRPAGGTKAPSDTKELVAAIDGYLDDRSEHGSSWREQLIRSRASNRSIMKQL